MQAQQVLNIIKTHIEKSIEKLGHECRSEKINNNKNRYRLIKRNRETIPKSEKSSARKNQKEMNDNTYFEIIKQKNQ